MGEPVPSAWFSLGNGVDPRSHTYVHTCISLVVCIAVCVGVPCILSWIDIFQASYITTHIIIIMIVVLEEEDLCSLNFEASAAANSVACMAYIDPTRSCNVRLKFLL